MTALGLSLKQTPLATARTLMYFLETDRSQGGFDMGTWFVHFSGLLGLMVLGVTVIPVSGSGEVSPKPVITSTSVTHVNFKSSKPFDAVTAAIEKQLGKFDADVYASLMTASLSEAEVESKIRAMEGSSGFMLFAVRDHGKLLGLKGKMVSARQYELGNPLFAVQMTQEDLRAGEYAPLRMYIYVGRDNMTHIDYDLPSTVFGRFKSPRVGEVAGILDHKLETLVTKALND
jgi:uncharacterized protein (DUF302 family)